MTKNTAPHDPATPADEPQVATPNAMRLDRPSDGRLVAGVCAGLARHTAIDPVVFRVLFGVLTALGGAGVVAYAVAWFVMPDAAEERSAAERMLGKPRGRLSDPRTVTLLLLAGCLLVVADQGRDGAIALLVLGGIAYLIHQQRAGTAPAWASPAMPAPHPTTAAAVAAPAAPVAAPRSSIDASGWTPHAAAQPIAQRPPKPRSRLGLVTLSVTALTAGALAAASVAGAEELTAARIVALSVVLVGAGLVVGAWIGRARWLIAVATVLALSIAPAAVGQSVVDDGTGTRFWNVDASLGEESFRLGAGEATLDLSAYAGSVGTASVRARIGAGHLVVLVPADTAVLIRAHVGVGDLSFPGGERGGTDVDRELRLGPAGIPHEVTVSVGLGAVEVRYA